MHELSPGDVLGRYRIEAIAGRGGMGLVYRARQQRPDRLVAIKVIVPELAADPAFRARFERESTIAAEIEHPNVIPVYDVDEDQGLLFIAMRYVPGGVDLGQLMLREQRFEPKRVVRLITQAASALDAAHARGLVHRDVKPGNVLVASDDHVYLTDFGLTKRIADSQGMTKTGMFVGTVDYIAPEQVAGKPLDGRADQYALGCVAYQLLAGEVPFPRESDVAKIFAHVNDPIPRLEGVPEPVAETVQRAMAKEPEERFSSTGEFARALDAGVRGQVPPPETVAPPTAQRPLPAPTQPKPERPKDEPPPRRSRRPLILALIGALLLAGLGTGLAIALSSGGPTPPPVPLPTTSSSSVTTSTPPPPPPPTPNTTSTATTSSQVDTVTSCLQGNGFTVTTENASLTGLDTKLRVKTSHNLFFVYFFNSAERATQFATGSNPIYDHFSNIAVGPLDGSADQQTVESCLH